MGTYIVKFFVTINNRPKAAAQVGIISGTGHIDTAKIQSDVAAWFRKFRGTDTVTIEMADNQAVSEEEYRRQLPINLPISEDAKP